MSIQATSTPQATSAQPSKTKTTRLTLGKVIGTTSKYALLIILVISFMLPLFWMVSSAMKDDSQVYTVPPVWIPNPAYPRISISPGTPILSTS
ncbi:MAG: hypothetical protein R2854_14480 [Caldilineaceae bacterium]